MFDKQLCNYPLEKVLEALGAKRGTVKDMWYSPFRNEDDASLHVDRQKNVWYDHGAGVGGTNVKLVMLTLRCNKFEAEKFIASLSPALQPTEQPKPERPKRSINYVKPLRSNYLARYLEIRKIPLNLAVIYCKEAQIHNAENGRNYLTVAFPNNSGGYALSNPLGLKSSFVAGITTLNTEAKMTTQPSSKKVAVFEGFWDFLSWQVMQGAEKPNCDVVVLNSVNNLARAVEYIRAHDSAYCFLDNDAAGKRCLQAITDLMKDKEVVDMSNLYSQHKDLNDMLKASRGYSSNMRLTP